MLIVYSVAMATQYHINGTCEVEYRHNKKVEEFYVDDVVRADSEVQAMTAVAKSMINGHQVYRFIWTRLTVEALKS